MADKSQSAETKLDFAVKKLLLAEFLAEGKRRFGPDTKKWKFKCVSCGHTQSMEDFVGLVDDPSTVVNFSCVGRWKKGTGCNWTLGGLFQIHKLEVEKEDGTTVPTFEFADNEAKE